MNLRKKLLCALFVFLHLSISYSAENATLDDGSQLELKGIGLAQELRNDIYIGAIYAPVGIESMSLITDVTTPKRVSIRYLANNYSYRKASRHWKERIAMNSDRTQWKPLTREIVGFANLINQNLISGDEIQIDYMPNKGTLISMNKVLLYTIDNPEFISLFIRSWIGSVPPTKAFKEGILGNLPESQVSSLLSQFNSLTPKVGRFAKKEEKVEQVASVAEQKPNTTVTAKPKAKITTPPKVVATTTAKPKEKPPENKTVVTTTKPVEKKEEVKKPPVQVATIEKPKPKLEKIQVPVIEEDFIDEDLIRGSYIRDLISEIRKNQTYPRKALVNGEQGDGVVHVIIDRNGELVEVILQERTGSRELDRAMIKMIRKSTPFPSVPDELSDPQFEFDVPVSFQL